MACFNSRYSNSIIAALVLIMVASGTPEVSDRTSTPSAAGKTTLDVSHGQTHRVEPGQTGLPAMKMAMDAGGGMGGGGGGGDPLAVSGWGVPVINRCQSCRADCRPKKASDKNKYNSCMRSCWKKYCRK